MVDVDVHISSDLKEELVWATDKRLRVISTVRDIIPFQNFSYCFVVS